jgi:hypothetical protein
MRPAGSYDIMISKEGFTTYRSRVTVQAGQELNLNGTLPEYKPGLTERWWFWSAIGTVVLAAAATTYFVTRPDPQRPPLDGGGLGWPVEVP